MIVPVILCGGSGTRLWPLSRREMAKQLAPVLEGETLLQRTLRRFADRTLYGKPILVSGAGQRFIAEDQAKAIGVEADYLLEPEARDTLAAIVAGALHAAAREGDPIVLIAPSDHLTPDVPAFDAAARIAAEAAEAGRIVTFGLAPRHPATGYGYIRPGAPITEGARAIAEFVEKPDAATAERLIREGCLWNAGLFCFRTSVGLDEARARAGDAVTRVEQALTEATGDLGATRLGEAFRSARKVSWDVAVMEHTARAAVAPVDFAWSDIGDWRELWAVSAQDADGNAVLGAATLVDCRGVLARSETRLVCALGLEDVVIVDTPDALLVADRGRTQEVKGLVARLEAEGRPEASTPARVHRPWGWYQTTDRGERFRVKRIQVAPGRKLSLQRHHHRAEHWVVVRGTAEVTIDAEVRLVRENESVYLPMGCVHRLANPGRIPVEIIEVQTGAYLEEDDIVRIEDDFGRDATG